MLFFLLRAYEKERFRRTSEESKVEGKQASKVRKMERRKRKGGTLNPKFTGNGPKFPKEQPSPLVLSERNLLKFDKTGKENPVGKKIPPQD